MKIFNLFKNADKTDKEERKVATVNTDFIKGISFEENPFLNETPTEKTIYDLDGNEVKE